MFLSLPSNIRIFVARDAVDMRKSFDGLSVMVKHQFHREPFSGNLFAFFNKQRDRVKLLLWDGNGLWVFREAARERRVRALARGHRRLL